jgi:ABC-type Fe3+ transport system permease subunit
MMQSVPTPFPSRRWDGIGGLALLLAVTLACVVLPAMVVLWRVGGELFLSSLSPSGSLLVPWRLIGLTLAYSGGVAILATILAVPAALVICARSWRWGLWVCTPLMLPSYLAYAGWGLLRAPRTLLGDAIERAAQRGATWLPAAVGEALAIGGLALWAWPIAAVMLTLHWSRIDAGALDALSLDARGFRRQMALANMGLPGLAVALGTTTLVMLGSPVPFHLAQVPTVSMEVWRRLMEEPTPARAWASALPIWIVVVAGVLAFARSAFDDAPVSQEAQARTTLRPRRVRATLRASTATLLVILTCSVLVPLVLFIRSIDDWRAVPVTLRSLRPAIANSAFVCVIVVGTGVLIAGAAWRAFSSFSAIVRRIARLCLLASLASCVMPGVLVGSALAATISLVDVTRLLADSSLAVGLGHLARFSFVPILVGWWLARTEPADARDLRQSEGVGGLAGYLSTILPTQLPALLGVAAILAALSLHEIESAIMLTPPGGGGLAYRMLGFLHYSKMGDLSVACVGMTGCALALAASVGVLGGRWERANRQITRS